MTLKPFEPGSVDDMVGGLMFNPAAQLAGQVLLLGGSQSEWLVSKRTIDLGYHYADVYRKNGWKTTLPFDEDAVKRGLSYLRDMALIEGGSVIKLSSLGVEVFKDLWHNYLTDNNYEPHQSYRSNI